MTRHTTEDTRTRRRRSRNRELGSRSSRKSAGYRGSLQVHALGSGEQVVSLKSRSCESPGAALRSFRDAQLDCCCMVQFKGRVQLRFRRPNLLEVQYFVVAEVVRFRSIEADKCSKDGQKIIRTFLSKFVRRYFLRLF